MLGGERQRRLTGLSTLCLIKWRRRPPFASQSGVFFFAPPPLPPFPPFPPSPGTKPRALSKAMGMPPRRAFTSDGCVRGGRCYTSVPCRRSPEIESPQRAFRSRSPAELGATAYTAAQMPLNPRATNHAQPTTRTQSRALNHAHSPSGSEDLQVFHGMSHQVAHLPPFCHRSTSGIVTAGGLLR